MRKANYYSKLFMGTAIVVIFAMVVIVLAFAFAPLKQTIAEVDENDSIVDFIEANDISGEIEVVKTMTDFAGNDFLLYEIDSEAYAIYSNGDVMRFIEGSPESYSPVHDYLDADIYYVGPFSYYYANEDGELVDPITGDIVEMSALVGTEYDFDEIAENYEENLQETPSISPMSYETADNFVFVDNASYFQNLSNFPIPTEDGTCGIIAISILLGYYDTFVHDSFLDDSYINHYTVGVSSVDLLDSVNIYPSVKQSFYDYIYNNHLVYSTALAAGLGGHPMTNSDLEDTMRNYIETTPLSGWLTYYNGSIIQTHANPRQYIQNDMPTLMILSKYEHQVDGEWHVVVAYGYNEAMDSFYVHYGWRGSTFYRVLISEYTCYGYFAMELSTDAHTHSDNATVYVDTEILGVTWRQSYPRCGCGYLGEQEITLLI